MADLRSWTLLPASLQAARARLPVGNHDVVIALRGRGGDNVGLLEATVPVTRRGLTIVNVRSIGLRAVAHVAVIR